MHPDQSNSAGMLADQISQTHAERISQHLHDEESALICVLDAVRSLHHSLQFMKAEEMSRSLEGEATALGAAQDIQCNRHEFRTEMGSIFGLPPDQLTLTVLVQKTSGTLRESIVESRRKLSELAAELNILNRQNAAMIQQSLKLLRGIIGRLTKSAGFGEAYNAGGARAESHVGSLLEWGG